MAVKIAQPCRVFFDHLAVRVRKAGAEREDQEQLDEDRSAASGSRSDAAELALTKPPPLVPSSLITSCEPIGPPVIDCVKPSIDFTVS